MNRITKGTKRNCDSCRNLLQAVRLVEADRTWLSREGRQQKAMDKGVEAVRLRNDLANHISTHSS